MKKVISIIIILVASMFAGTAFIAKASSTSFNNLDKYDFGVIASSLKVSGTVTVYDNYNCQGNSISFSNQWVHALGDYGRGWWPGNWGDAIRSLKIDGSVTLYADNDYVGKAITFTSSSIPYDNLGTEWNQNPLLVQSQGKWDARVWDWKGPYPVVNWPPSTLHRIDPDASNYVYWTQNGLVTAKSTSNDAYYYKAEEFAQGFERSVYSVSSLVNYPLVTNNGLNWNDRVCSLKVDGTVILYWDSDYHGSSIVFTNTWVPDLGSWDRQVTSLNVSGMVTLYDSTNYGGNKLVFDCKPSYQPPLTPSIGSMQSLTLEGIVDSWSTNLGQSLTSWTGAKFDVWAVENKGTGKKLMLELYFLRTGLNLQWYTQSGGSYVDYYRATDPNSDTRNYLVSIDAFYQYVNRVAYSGDIQKWSINVITFINNACSHWPELNKNNLYISKICFTLEAGGLTGPTVQCNLERLRIAYK